MDKPTIKIKILNSDFLQTHVHLFPGDDDEHGAVFAVSLHRDTAGNLVLIVHRVFIAIDGVDYLPGKFGYCALSAEFVAKVSDYCHRHKLGYLAVHNHKSDRTVGFSDVDLASHERGYPALVDILCGEPVGALVFGKNSVAGRLWIDGAIYDFDELIVVSSKHKRLNSGRRVGSSQAAGQQFDRQSRMFGESGQRILANSRIGIVGLGGAGSLINQWLARLGVGEIVAIDYDWFEVSNYSRVDGSAMSDAVDLYSDMDNPNAKRKVDIAERLAKAVNPKISYEAIPKNVVEAKVAAALKNCDFIFLCADSMQARLVFNAIVNQFLIPGIQVGAKVPVDKESGDLLQTFAVSRPVFPGPNSGCLLCNELIPGDKLQDEAISDDERRDQRYVEDDEVVAPSVITMNAVACADAINTFLFTFLGLAEGGFDLRYHMQFCQERSWTPIETRSNEDCFHCGRTAKSGFGMGDSVELPCR